MLKRVEFEEHKTFSGFLPVQNDPSDPSLHYGGSMTEAWLQDCDVAEELRTCSPHRETSGASEEYLLPVKSRFRLQGPGSGGKSREDGCCELCFPA